jgi:hypothetical protein
MGKKHLIWCVSLAWPLGLAWNESSPGCVSLRDDQGKPILWACRFAGAALGPGLVLLLAALPFLLLPLVKSRGHVLLLGLLKMALLLTAWVAYVRWDLLALGPTGVAELIRRGGVLYAVVLGMSVVTALTWNRRTHVPA